VFCVYIPHFLDPFIWVVSIAWLLWIVLQWTSVQRCLYCILTYVPWIICWEVVLLAVLSLAFWGISILLSVMVVIICISTSIKCIRILVSPHPHQHLLLWPLIMIILTGVRWNLSVILICISCIAREVEHVLMYLLAICTSSFENSLYNSCVHFLIWVLILWGLRFLSSL
jgi:hypothetical protein